MLAQMCFGNEYNRVLCGSEHIGCGFYHPNVNMPAFTLITSTTADLVFRLSHCYFSICQYRDLSKTGFWGGGFVAPFLATFYYFGFKFWEK